MIERTIKTFLDQWIAFYRSAPVRFERFLVRELGIDADEAAKLRAYFAADGWPKVVVGYARESGPFPCIAIVLGSDTIRQRFIANDMGPAGSLVGDDGEAEDEPFRDQDNNEAEGRVWLTEPRYDLWIYALDNADVCLVYYYLVRHIILSNVDELISGDLSDLQLSGADMAPDPRYLPENMFVRRLSLTGLAMEQGWKSATMKATSMDGLTHEDSGGGLTPYEE